ncbi:hypothetical protein KXV87_009473 [Aspergillus fumigatus]|nr:hypothetical protein KXV87_009473 [Aspergillus fumigatus]
MVSIIAAPAQLPSWSAFFAKASDFIACSPKQTVGLAQSLGESEFVGGLQREAQQAGLHINVGIHEPTAGERVKNSSIWIDDRGVITQRYHTVHLFDATTPGESTTVEKGKGILPVFETPVGRVGLLICFDLRFPEISLALRRQDAQIISYASAFLAQTGPAHWETLLRARAIETQCYIIAAAQAGQHNKGRASYGHAMIVNPWGEVVAKLGEEPKEPQIATAEIDFDFFSRLGVVVTPLYVSLRVSLRFLNSKKLPEPACLLCVGIAGYFINYAVETWPGTSSATGSKYLAGAQGAFTVGRFSGALLMKYMRARWVFLAYLSGVVAFLAASITQREQNGIAMLFVTMFFESVCFPTIVALGIRGLGRHYKRGSGFIVGGVCGGAVVPPLLGHVADMHNSTGFAMIVPTMFMVAAWTYAVAVNFVPAYRDTVDKVGDSQIGLTEGGGAGVMKDIEARGMEKSAEGSVQIEH